MRLTILKAGLLLKLLPVPCWAQVVTEMTPERIRDAIAFGTSQKEAPDYEIRERGFVGSVYKPRLGSFTTPFLRVALAAYEAKKQYKPFTEVDVTKEMVAPELHVYGSSQTVGARVANVQGIIITPKGRHDPADAIRPSSTTEVPIQYRNLMGMTAEGKSLLAVFPLDTLREANEVHIIYDSGVHHGGKNKFCEDCFVEFKLDKVR
jgi:hypothetical protein